MNEAQRSERRVDRLVGRRQLLNWRWWIALPLIVVLFPCAILTGVVGWADEQLAPLTNRLMRWIRAG